MALLKTTEAQERVDAAHHNVYNMHTMGRAWRELVVRYDRSSHTLDVHFISSLPVILRSACMVGVDRAPVQIVVAEG